MNDHDRDRGSEETIFSTALRLRSAVEQGAYVDEVCAGDAGRRARVEGLLKAQPELGEFMEGPAARTASGPDGR